MTSTNDWGKMSLYSKKLKDSLAYSDLKVGAICYFKNDVLATILAMRKVSDRIVMDIAPVHFAPQFLGDKDIWLFDHESDMKRDFAIALWDRCSVLLPVKPRILVRGYLNERAINKVLTYLEYLEFGCVIELPYGVITGGPVLEGSSVEDFRSTFGGRLRELSADGWEELNIDT